jgi:aspartate/methionine/tyrosine aminotransferase
MYFADFGVDGFDFGVSVRAAVTPVVATVPSLASVFHEEAFIQSLENAYETAECSVKALMLTNPHNPLSLCYSRSILEACVQFCERRKIHFICDEVYALSVFQSPDLPDAHPFVSVLSLDLKKLGVEPSRVHAVWSMSKDFGQSGVRMGLSISQSNQEMAVACALAAQMQISTLTSTFVTALLTAPDLDDLIRLNAKRLTKAYATITDFFKEVSIPYIPCNAGLYVFAKLAPKAETWQDECAVVTKLKEAGVLVSSGKAYHGPEGEKGWARVGFAVEPKELDEAIERMRIVFAGARADLSKEVTNSKLMEESTKARNKRRMSLIDDRIDGVEQEHGKRVRVY